MNQQPQFERGRPRGLEPRPVPDVPERLTSRRGQHGGVTPAEILWRSWFDEFNRARANKPRGVVRCLDDDREVLGHLRVIDGRLVLGRGYPHRGFDVFHLVLTDIELDDAGLEAEDPWVTPLCEKHPRRDPAQQRERLRRAAETVSGPQLKMLL